MDYLQKWRDELLSRTAVSFPKIVVVEGEQAVDLGPRSEFARISLRFEPFDRFDAVLDRVPQDIRLRSFAKYAILGALDVLLTGSKYPVTNVRIFVEQIDSDPVKSNEMAYRLAARKAARDAMIKAGFQL